MPGVSGKVGRVCVFVCWATRHSLCSSLRHGTRSAEVATAPAQQLGAAGGRQWVATQIVQTDFLRHEEQQAPRSSSRNGASPSCLHQQRSVEALWVGSAAAAAAAMPRRAAAVAVVATAWPLRLASRSSSSASGCGSDPAGQHTCSGTANAGRPWRQRLCQAVA